jgi:hypothetical protein
MSDLQVAVCPDCGRQLFHDGSIAGRTLPCPQCESIVQIPDDNGCHHDPKRTLSDGGTGLEGTLYGQAPVQAEGHILGHPFYFRAKWNYWTFTVSVNSDADPACIEPKEDEPGFFEVGESQGYYLSGEFNNASFMRYDDAERIIRDCVQQFILALKQRAV